MTIEKRTYLDSFYQFLSESEQKQEYDYYALAKLIRAYVDDAVKQISNEHGMYIMRTGEYFLTITQHQGRGIATSIKLMGAHREVEIFGIYHHGAEELFLFTAIGAQEEFQEPRLVTRSLRHQNDETIKQSMRWFLSVLLLMDWHVSS